MMEIGSCEDGAAALAKDGESISTPANIRSAPRHQARTDEFADWTLNRKARHRSTFTRKLLESSWPTGA
jgi:hypothetical protein